MPCRPSQVEKLRNQIAMPTVAPSTLDDVAEHGGCGPNSASWSSFLGRLDGLVGRSLVLGQLADEPEQGGDVRRAGGPDHDRRP